MPNIDAIRIRGFQSHVDSRFRLGPGLNVITGPSDAGKTSIIRAVRWVAFNEPTGEAFLNESVGEAEVVIELDTGVTIIKRRRKGKTGYELSTMDEPFEKAEVPEEVKTALGITKQGFGDFETALNFAFQLEAPFLISETASAGAKVLGKLAGTEVVDLATKSVAKDTYQARQEKIQAEKDIQRLDGYLLEYEDLDDLKKQLEACQFLISECDEQLSRTNTLQDVYRKQEAANDQIAAVALKLDSLAVLPEIEEDLKGIEKAQQRYDRLLDLYSLLNKTTDQVAVLTEQLNQFAQLGDVTDHLTAATNSSERVQAITSLYAGYQKYAQAVNHSNEILESTSGIQSLSDDLTAAAQAYERLDALRNTKVQFVRHSTTIDQCRQSVAQFEVLDDVSGLIVKLVAGVEEHDALARWTTKLKTAKDAYHAENIRVAAAEQDLEVAQREYTDAWAGLDVCPLCEQPISGGEHIGH